MTLFHGKEKGLRLTQKVDMVEAQLVRSAGLVSESLNHNATPWEIVDIVREERESARGGSDSTSMLDDSRS